MNSVWYGIQKDVSSNYFHYVRLIHSQKQFIIIKSKDTEIHIKINHRGED